MDIGIKVDVQGALLTGKAPEIVSKQLDAAITVVTAFLHAEVVKRTPQGVMGAKGGLMGNIKHNVVQKGTPIVKGTVMHTSLYGDIVEKGRRPGKGIPIDALTTWIERKLGISDPKAIRRVAILISTKAKKQGIEGAHMFERALTENESKIEQMFKQFGFNITEELSDNNIPG